MCLIYLRAGSLSLDGVVRLGVPIPLAVPTLALAIVAFALFEAKRAPYDHTEAESELVAGHLIEFGGRYLLLYFICEYAHVYFCVFTLSAFLIGTDPVPFWAMLA